MPSTSAAQHRWIGWLHSNPEARAHSGMSQAKVDEWLHSDRGSPWKHAMGGPIGYDGGGMIDPAAGSIALNPPDLGGVVPSPASASPLNAQTAQRYAQMPTEKLQELAMMAGNSPQGQLIRKLLAQKHMMPNVQPQAMGGMVQHRQGGGMLGMGLSEAEPWWTRAEARAGDAGPMTGYLHGATAGRADNLKGTALSDSYILPAEEIAGLGEGNSLMGARVIQAMLGSGPYGTPMPRGSHGRGPPHPPPAQEPRAKGGEVGQEHTKVALSHGEFALTPEQVRDVFGGGDIKRGHRVLDLWVQEMRRRHIKELQKLRPPVGAKKT
jgi:hypothetical protein